MPCSDSPTFVLGISYGYHDAAAALVSDGHIVAAAQEERFSRVKGDSGFPTNAISYCLETAGIVPADLKAVVYYDKPLVTFERLLSSHLHRAPFGIRGFLRAIPQWLGKKLWIESQIAQHLQGVPEILFCRHHHSHAASAFFSSPFSSAAILTMDGVGEWATTAIGQGQDHQLSLHKTINFPHSLGLFYSAFTQYCGFRVNFGEYKLMGLAPYGKPRFKELILERLLHLSPDGSFSLNQRYFDYCAGLRMINSRFEKLFGASALLPGQTPGDVHLDVAASAQAALEDAVLALAREARRSTHEKNLVMAGGVALNCVANSHLVQESGFDQIWVQPASHDAGAALGAALYASHALYRAPRPHLDKSGHDGMRNAALGPAYTDDTIRDVLDALQASYLEMPFEKLVAQLSRDLDAGQVAGWFQGSMEFGPRALGNRSILADPRPLDMKDRLNAVIKQREAFRPFAPVVLLDDASRWFQIQQASPYMLLTAPVRSDAPGALPAVTHIDGSARIQTVTRHSNFRLCALLEAFHSITGCPVLVNTSFNVRGEPMVCHPRDAYHCFMGSGLDVLVIGNFYLRKSDQKMPERNPALKMDAWKGKHIDD